MRSLEMQRNINYSSDPYKTDAEIDKNNQSGFYKGATGLKEKKNSTKQKQLVRME